MPRTIRAPVDLPPRYYLDNFRQLCSVVEQRYGDVLKEHEWRWLNAFRTLKVEAQCLYLRLLMRVGPNFRSDRLTYGEIGDIAGSIAELGNADLMAQQDSLSLEQAFALYTREELAGVYAAELGLPSGTSKARLITGLDEADPEPTQLLQRMQVSYPGVIVTPLQAEHLQLFELLFFGNRRQSLTDFILSDIGLFRYYNYSWRDSERYFSDRRAIDEYLELGGLGDLLEEITPLPAAEVGLQALALEVLAIAPLHPSSLRRYHRLCNRLGRELERAGELAAASQCYAQSQRHPARERRARIKERCEDWAGAVSCCEEILASPWCEAELEAANRILPRVQRKLGVKPAPRRRHDFPRRDLMLPPTDDRVELAAAGWYASEWPLVCYVENTLFNSLFGLAFWDVLFSDQPGVWFHPFQDAPADLYEPDFMQRRHTLFESRFAALSGPDREREILAAFHNYRGYRCRWVSWSHLNEELLRAALSCIPWSHLEPLWRRQLFDLQENRSGLPDLILLDPAQHRYCLAEVKGPGDALQDNQKRWLRFFAATGMPHEVTWVAWAND